MPVHIRMLAPLLGLLTAVVACIPAAQPTTPAKPTEAPKAAAPTSAPAKPAEAAKEAPKPAEAAKPAAPASLTKLRWGQIGGISDAAFFIAVDKGYLAEQGIELEVTRFASAAEMVAPLGAGQLDIGGGAPSTGLYNAVAREVTLKIVADKGNLNPGHGYEALLVRKDLVDSIKSGADLKGKTIALSARDITPERTLDELLRMSEIGRAHV